MFICHQQRQSIAFDVDCGLNVFRYCEMFITAYGNFSLKRRTMKSVVI